MDRVIHTLEYENVYQRDVRKETAAHWTLLLRISAFFAQKLLKVFPQFEAQKGNAECQSGNFLKTTRISAFPSAFFAQKLLNIFPQFEAQKGNAELQNGNFMKTTRISAFPSPTKRRGLVLHPPEGRRKRKTIVDNLLLYNTQQLRNGNELYAL